jgi:integrase
MNTLVSETLKNIKRESDYVFCNPTTKERIKDVKTAFKAACRRGEISDLRFHDLRHTAATKMIEAGVDLVTVSKILGHSSIQMTMRYAHPTPENMQRAVGKLAEIFTPKRKELPPADEEKVTTPSFLIK